MTKSEMKEHLKKRVNVSSVINEKIIVFYKQDFKGIVELKKELRLLTKKYEDFYKRVDGFYNKNISIHLHKENDSIDTFLATTFFINTEEEADSIKEVIIEFVESFYNRQTFYTVSFSSDFFNYKINFIELNEIELKAASDEIILNRKSNNKTKPQDLFDTELEAKREALRIISSKITEINHMLSLLQETKEDIESDIKKGWENDRKN